MIINVLEYFTERVKLFPNRIAIIDGERECSFSSLNQQSAALGTFLAETCKCTNRPIAVYLPKSIEAVIADIAITMSGNIYMNLDVKTPAERIGNITRVVDPVAIITTSDLASKISGVIHNQITIIDINQEYPYKDTSAKILEVHRSRLIDTDPYCIINTSGSTGTPKGVVLNHKSFIDFIEWSCDALQIGEHEIIGSLSPIVFDIYSQELMMMMKKGSTMVLLPENLSAFPIKILEILQKQSVSFIFWVPTIMVNIANMDLLRTMELTALKTVWFAGEVLPTKQYNYWHKHMPWCKFVNLYGPIEITLDCTYFIVDREFDDSEPLPIGVPCRNTSLLILNQNNEECGIGEEGELCVRGTSLAMGYYNNPEKTAEAFVQNPLNTKYPEIVYRTGDIVSLNDRNEIVFKGRRDTLIKHLGYRIELGEIEHVIINTLKLVSNGCIVYDQKAKLIVLFYENPTEISTAEFRKAIGQNLPKYMIPNNYLKQDKLPMNANGKIDRLQLNILING